MNYVILAGNLTRDPEVRALPSGTRLAKLRLAINDTRKDAQGKKVESTTYVDVEAWGPIAEGCERDLHKGSPALVEGRLRLDEWDAKDGKKRSRLLVRANRVDSLSGRKAASDAGGSDDDGGPPPTDEQFVEEGEPSL